MQCFSFVPPGNGFRGRTRGRIFEATQSKNALANAFHGVIRVESCKDWSGGDTGLIQKNMSNSKTTVSSAGEPVAAGLSAAQLIEFYRLMYLSRRTDDREILLKRQQKIFFQISCAGHEALLVAAGVGMMQKSHLFFLYYRDRALCLGLGNTVEEQLLQSLGAADDQASGGRQIPSHWASKKLNIVSS